MAEAHFEPLDEFYSFDTYHSEPQDRSLSVIPASNPAEGSDNESDVFLEKDIQSLKFQDGSNKQLLSVQANIEQLAKHQSLLEERLKSFGERLSGNYVVVPQAESEDSPMKKKQQMLREYEVIERELTRGRESLAEQQRKIQRLSNNIRQSEQSPNSSPSCDPKSSRVQLQFQQHTMEQAMRYSSEPNFQKFKQCSLTRGSQQFPIYDNGSLRIDYSRTEQGISLELVGNSNSILRVGTFQSDRIDIPWSRFSFGKFVENCDIVDRKLQSRVSTPVPLPLSFLFEQRLTYCTHSQKYNALKKLMSCYELRIRHFDREVWQQLQLHPQLLHFSRQEDGESLIHAISLKGTKQLFVVQLAIRGQYLLATILHKSGSNRLRDMLQFYGFLLVA